MNIIKRSRQRNYKRNGDIIYSSISAVNSNNIFDYIIDLDGIFIIVDDYLYYEYEDGTHYYLKERIRPYSFIQMYVDNNMILNGYYDNDTKNDLFLINTDGDLIWQQ